MKETVRAFSFLEPVKPKDIPGVPGVAAGRDPSQKNVELLQDITRGRTDPGPVNWGNKNADPRVAELMEILKGQRDTNKPE